MNEDQPEREQDSPQPERVEVLTEDELMKLFDKECAEASAYLIEKFGSPHMCIDYGSYEDWKRARLGLPHQDGV